MKEVLMDNILYIRKRLKKKLDEDRYEHTLGVAYTATCLAMRYHCDLYQAEVAGLLHDCAKYLPDELKIERCRRYHITMTGAFLPPPIYHSSQKSTVRRIFIDNNAPEW